MVLGEGDAPEERATDEEVAVAKAGEDRTVDLAVNSVGTSGGIALSQRIIAGHMVRARTTVRIAVTPCLDIKTMQPSRIVLMDAITIAIP